MSKTRSKFQMYIPHETLALLRFVRDRKRYSMAEIIVRSLGLLLLGVDDEHTQAIREGAREYHANSN